MGCGSPLGDLFYLADALIAGRYAGQAASGLPAARLREQPTEVESAEDLRARLYRMHGEGQIGEEVFHALRTPADRGQLRPADLTVHLAHAKRGVRQPGDAAIQNALGGTRARLAQLAQARAASEKVLADLESRLVKLEERMAAKEQAARQLLAQDEESARQRLAEMAVLANSRDRLAAQAHALRADLGQLGDLHARLEAKSAELEAIQARSELSQEMLK